MMNAVKGGEEFGTMRWYFLELHRKGRELKAVQLSHS